MSETIISGRPPIKSEQTQVVTGPLTDTQLRATPVPVSGTVSTSSPTPYSLQYEEASSTVTYIGEAASGSATSSAVWRIKKMDTSSGIVITWASGTTAFDKTWTGRAGYSYS